MPSCVWTPLRLTLSSVLYALALKKIQNEHVLDLNAETGHTAWGSLAELPHVRVISTLHFRVACALFVLLFSIWLERM